MANKSPVSGPGHLVFFCWYAKIAGSIGILPRCVLNDFITQGVNVFTIFEASL